MWRILAYPIHYRQTVVVPLTFHEEGKQPIYYREGESAQNVMDHDSLDESQFLALFELNKRDEEARQLLYEEIPSKYISDGKEKYFFRRKTRTFAIGRIIYVPPTIDDAYHLRILLNSIRGPTSFDHIKIVNDVVHKTYREACYTLGLLDDDKEYIEGIKEAHFMCSPKFVRKMFVRMLLAAVLSTPHIVWEETWEMLSEYILRRKRVELKRPAVRIRGEIVLNTASSSISSLLLEGGRTAHSTFGIPLDVHEESMCRMSRSSDLGELVQEAKLIIWDEAPMMSKYCFETLDRSLKGEERIYLSSDSIDPADKRNKDNLAYSPHFLNSVRISGVSNHALRLKIGCPVMLLRNIDPHGGLMNGTRLQITQKADHVIQARIITGTRVGKIVLLPRMVLIPSDTRLPYKMRRIQFLINVAFAMTINKSQCQSLSNIGLYLPKPVFSHGQLYVAMSRVSSKSGLKILITDPKEKPQKKTSNVVFKEVFQNI
ncbi:PREDICTED: uncharacterized protein LOC104744195 [Camelina sativa]|uniref:ATP-dependent DNA helicase n=1 Tax=Camelina sativa TaxID=90675 RepID=A0ABM0VZ97_CAMSA|nr:PREDICTED: uncharacterized protein LOC104744195 [Camelina sativa]